MATYDNVNQTSVVVNLSLVRRGITELDKIHMTHRVQSFYKCNMAVRVCKPVRSMSSSFATGFVISLERLFSLGNDLSFRNVTT